MALIEYRLLYDLDGDFVPEEDLTGLLVGLEWREGFAENYAPLVEFGLIRLVLYNDGRFVYGSDDYVVGRRIRVEARLAPASFTLIFDAVIRKFEIGSDGLGRSVANLECMRFLENLAVQVAWLTMVLATQENVASDEVMTALLSVAVTPVPLLGYFRLDVSQLDVDKLPAVLGYDVGPGQLEFLRLAGMWDGSETLLEVIEAITRSEYGRFWVGRDGTFYWRGRRYLMLENREIAYTVQKEDCAAIEYVYPAKRYRRVVVTGSPRIVRDEVVEVTRISSPIRLRSAKAAKYHRVKGDIVLLTPEQSQDTEVRVYYRDAAGNRVNAVGVVAPVAGTDWGATTAMEYGEPVGEDVTDYVSLGFEDRGHYAVVSFVNTYVGTVYIWQLVIRGQVVDDFSAVEAVAVNPDVSIVSGDLRIATLIDDYVDMVGYAIYVSQFFGDERGEVEWVEFEALNAAVAQALVDCYILDRVKLNLDDTGEYYIRAIEWRIEAGMSRVRWYLEPANTKNYIVLDTTELDVGRLVW